MKDNTKELEYSIAFIDGAIASDNGLTVIKADQVLDIRGWLEELRRLREKNSAFAKAS